MAARIPPMYKFPGDARRQLHTMVRAIAKGNISSSILVGARVTVGLPDALNEACMHAYHPVIRYEGADVMVIDFLWKWGTHSSEPCPRYAVFWDKASDGHPRFGDDVFSCLQRAVLEGEEEDRVFALFLMEAFETPEAKTVLASFLDSSHRKERWASTITLGRLKEVNVFLSLQNLLLEGFWPSEIFPRLEDLRESQKLDALDRKRLDMAAKRISLRGDFSLDEVQVLNEEEEARQNVLEAEILRLEDAIEKGASYFPFPGYVQVQLDSTDYEWYLFQRAECALVLGRWGNRDAVPALREAVQVAYTLEQEWPDYIGPDEEGPENWYFIEDRLLFALGQLGDTGVWSSLRLPEAHLLVARIYWSLGRLEIQDDRIFSQGASLFDASLGYGGSLFRQDEDYTYVNPHSVQQVLAEYFDLSTLEQDTAIIHWREAWVNRRNERLLASPYEG